MMNARQRLWIALLPALLVPGIGALVYFHITGEGPIAQGFYGLSKLFTLVWPLIAWRWLLWRGFGGWQWRSAHHWRSIPLGAATGIGIVAIAWGLMATPLGEIVRAAGPRMREKTAALGVLEHYWLFACFLSIIHSLIEEYYWRWFVYGRTAELLPGYRAHLIAAIGFTLHHVIVLSTFFGLGWGLFFSFFVGVGGAIWSLLYQRQRSLIGIWISHMIVDFGVLAIGHTIIMSATS